MNAVNFSEYGPADVLTVAEVDDPRPAAGQVRIAVRTAGVNPFDAKLRAGYMRSMMELTFPKVPGSDVAGVVDELGEGVTGVAVGDEVFGEAVDGSYAEKALLKRWTAKPGSLSWEQVAGLTSCAETTGRALGLFGALEGRTLLVNGAAGGVGLVAVQIAVARGATVIGIAGPDNQDFVRSIGATPTTYGDGLVERVGAVAAGGVDVAFDCVGNGVLPELIELTGDPKNVVTIADFAAGELGAHLTTGGEGRAWEVVDEAVALADDGRLELPVRATFPLKDAVEAHRAIETGHGRGKIVLLVS